MSEEMLGTPEVAARLDLRQGAVRQRCQRGEIEATKRGGEWRIPCSEVERIRDRRWQKYGTTERLRYPG